MNQIYEFHEFNCFLPRTAFWRILTIRPYFLFCMGFGLVWFGVWLRCGMQIRLGLGLGL